MDTKLLKQKILDLAIRGKLVPQDPNDEPASVLLERIRAEREKLIAEGKLKRTKKTSDNRHYENLPSSWCVCSIEDVFDITMGSSPSGSTLNKDKNGIEFHQGKIYFSDTYLKESDVYTNMPTKLAEAHSILLCVRAPVGIINITERKICIGRGLCSLKPRTGIDFMFAFYALQTHKNHFDEQATGTTFKAIGGDTIRNESFILPPLTEQVRIVAEIQQWFSIIDQLETNRIKLHETTKQARSKILDLAIHGKLVSQDPNDEPAVNLLKRIAPNSNPCDTSHYENLPQNWCEVKLGDVGTWQAGGTPKRGVKEFYGGHIPWLKTGDLNDGFITEIPECITQSGLRNSSAKLNPRNSVLIAMYGATIGKVGILTFPAATNQACCACVSYPALEKMYLFYFLLSHKNIFISQGGGGAQPNISKEVIVNTHIPLPPLEEQKRIVAKVSELLSLLDKITAEL